MKRILLATTALMGLTKVVWAEPQAFYQNGIEVGTVQSLGIDPETYAIYEFVNTSASTVRVSVFYPGRGEHVSDIPANSTMLVQSSSPTNGGGITVGMDIEIRTIDLISNNYTGDVVELQISDDFTSPIFDDRNDNGLAGLTVNELRVLDQATAYSMANSADISENTAAIESNDTDIATNATNIATNATDVATNATNIATNATDVATNATNIATNTTDVATNATNIATNATGISTNGTAISANQTAITSNATNITRNAESISLNTGLINQNAKGIAGSMAMAMIQQDLNGEGWQVSFGGANFHGTSGFAVVAGTRLDNNVYMNFGATDAGNYAGSVTIRW